MTMLITLQRREVDQEESTAPLPATAHQLLMKRRREATRSGGGERATLSPGRADDDDEAADSAPSTRSF